MTIKIHPIFKNYGYNTDTNEIINIPLNRRMNQSLNKNGYCFNTFTYKGNTKSMCSHRFIYEACNDIIIKAGYEIDHIDKNKANNTISNLRCVTIQENRKNRDFTNLLKIQNIAHTLKRYIKAICIETGEYICFVSKSQCAKHLKISPALVYLVSSGIAKTANTLYGKYTFEYMDEQDAKNLIKIPHALLGKKKNI